MREDGVGEVGSADDGEGVDQDLPEGEGESGEGIDEEETGADEQLDGLLHQPGQQQRTVVPIDAHSEQDGETDGHQGDQRNCNR